MRVVLDTNTLASGVISLTHRGVASEVRQQFGAAEVGNELKGFNSSNRVYVTRPHGGVGGGGREVPSYPDLGLGNRIE